MSSSRNINADFLKTISIFGVVYIHSSSLFNCISSYRMLFLWQFRFAVPFFVIIWAYFFEKSLNKNNESVIKFLFKKFYYTFRLFLVWSFIYFLFNCQWSTLTARDLLTKYFSGFGWSGQYFFLIMLQGIIFYPLIRICYKIRFLRYTVLICILTLYLIFEFNLLEGEGQDILYKLGYRPIIYWIPYIFLGIKLSRLNTQFNFNIFLSLLILSIIPIELYLLNLSSINREYITLGILFSSIISCSIILKNRPLKTPLIFERFFKYTGKNTLVVFITNPLIIFLLKIVIDPHLNGLCYNSIILKILIPIISTCLVFTICILIGHFIKKTMLRKILL